MLPKNWFRFIIFILLVFSVSVAHAREFIIMCDIAVPFRFKDENIVLKGIDVGTIKYVMQALKLEYKIQFITSSTRMIMEAQQGKIDMLLSWSSEE